jgi:hypothetical protein
MEELMTRIWEMLIGREHGPLAFRLVILPTVAALLAIRAGLRDARAGRPAFGGAFFTHSRHRLERLRAGWNDLARLFAAAVIIDLIYEIYVFRWIYPGQALIVAAIVAFPSYMLVRGLANRIARPWVRSDGGAHEEIPTARPVPANRQQ